MSHVLSCRPEGACPDPHTEDGDVMRNYKWRPGRAHGDGDIRSTVPVKQSNIFVFQIPTYLYPTCFGWYYRDYAESRNGLNSILVWRTNGVAMTFDKNEERLESYPLVFKEKKSAGLVGWWSMGKKKHEMVRCFVYFSKGGAKIKQSGRPTNPLPPFFKVHLYNQKEESCRNFTSMFVPSLVCGECSTTLLFRRGTKNNDKFFYFLWFEKTEK